MKVRIIFILPLLSILVIGCAPKVMVPPKISLKKYEMIGLIDISTNTEDNLGEYITQIFMESITEDQPEIKIIELGTEEEILKEIGSNKLTSGTIAAIGNKYNLNSLFIGYLQIDNVKPEINVDYSFTSGRIRAKVDATFYVKLYETKTGATIWTESAKDGRTVADINMVSGGWFQFDAQDPEKAYGELAKDLVESVTEDFRVSWKRKK